MSAPGGVPYLMHVSPETIRVPGRPQVHRSRATAQSICDPGAIEATCPNSGATKGNGTAWTVHHFRHEVTDYVRWRLEADIQMGTDGDGTMSALGQWQTVDRGSNESGLAGHR